MAGSVKTPLSLQGPQTGQRSPVLSSQRRPVLPLGPGLTLPTVPADRRRGQAWPVLLAPALLSGRRPQASDPGATLALEARPSEELPSSLCGHHCKSSQAPCWLCRRNHGDRLGRRPESARLSPVRTEGPGGHTAPHPGWRGQRGRGPPRGEAGRVCSPPPWKRRGRAGGTVPHPERNRRGGQGAQPCQVASICPGPTGMHLRLMESNNASTGDSHWLLRAFNPASLSSQGFVR